MSGFMTGAALTMAASQVKVFHTILCYIVLCWIQNFMGLSYASKPHEFYGYVESAAEHILSYRYAEPSLQSLR